MTKRAATNKTDESFKLSNKSYVIILFATLFIVLVSSLHGVTEAWAWELARNLITVDGLILGFIIFGATILSRRSFVITRYKLITEEIADKLTVRRAEYEQSGKTLEEWVEKESKPLVDKSFFRFGFHIGSLLGHLSFSVTMILVSIGLAFCLFGVNDANKTSSTTFLFFVVHYAAVFFFLAGVYYSFQLFVAILEESAMLPEEPTKTIVRLLEERRKQVKRQSKKP